MKDVFADIGWLVVVLISLIPFINLERHVAQRLSAPLSVWDVLVSIVGEVIIVRAIIIFWGRTFGDDK